MTHRSVTRDRDILISEMIESEARRALAESDALPHRLPLVEDPAYPLDYVSIFILPDRPMSVRRIIYAPSERFVSDLMFRRRIWSFLTLIRRHTDLTRVDVAHPYYASLGTL